jgi:hypothetical protein
MWFAVAVLKTIQITKNPMTNFRIFLATVFVFIAWVLDIQAVQASIGVGDIAVIGVNGDGATTTARDFTVVTLAPIPSGETIFITDKGISLGVFQASLTTEGIFSWTTTSTIAAGTVIKFTITSGSTPIVVSNPSVGTLVVTEGWTAAAAPLPSTGDQILIFQGSVSSPVFIFGFHDGVNVIGVVNGWNTTGGTQNNYSEIPLGLTNGANAIGFAGTSPLNNFVYNGSLSGTKATVLAAICTASNWLSADLAGTGYDLSPGGTQFPGTNPIFTVTASNNAPTDIGLSGTTINENVAVNTVVGTLSSVDPDAANTFTYTLVAGTGDTDNASFNISGSDLRIGISPNFEVKSSYSVRIRTQDQGGLAFEKFYTISINNVNETPTDLVLSASSVNENVAVNTTVGTFTSTDPDAANTFTYTLVAGTGDTDNASFNISGSDLRIGISPDFEVKNSYSVRIRTQDQGGLSFEKFFTISINNINETPTDLVLSASSINENVAVNTTAGSFSSTDPDAANTFTYTLVAGTGDTDNASFNISGSDLRIGVSPNFEVKSSYSVRIRTQDQGGLNFEKFFTISVNNANEGPTDLALSATSVNENAAANTTVGTFTSTDPDATNTFTYTLVAGTGDTDNASFNISGSDLRIGISPNFEAKNSYSVRIRTEDQDGLTYEESFTININNINETSD